MRDEIDELLENEHSTKDTIMPIVINTMIIVIVILGILLGYKYYDSNIKVYSKKKESVEVVVDAKTFDKELYKIHKNELNDDNKGYLTILKEAETGDVIKCNLERVYLMCEIGDTFHMVRTTYYSKTKKELERKYDFI